MSKDDQGGEVGEGEGELMASFYELSSMISCLLKLATKYTLSSSSWNIGSTDKLLSEIQWLIALILPQFAPAKQVF